MRKLTTKEIALACIAAVVLLGLANSYIEKTKEPQLSEEFKEMYRKICAPVRQDEAEYKRCMEGIE